MGVGGDFTMYLQRGLTGNSPSPYWSRRFQFSRKRPYWTTSRLPGINDFFTILRSFYAVFPRADLQFDFNPRHSNLWYPPPPLPSSGRQYSKMAACSASPNPHNSLSSVQTCNCLVAASYFPANSATAISHLFSSETFSVSPLLHLSTSSCHFCILHPATGRLFRPRSGLFYIFDFISLHYCIFPRPSSYFFKSSPYLFCIFPLPSYLFASSTVVLAIYAFSLRRYSSFASHLFYF